MELDEIENPQAYVDRVMRQAEHVGAESDLMTRLTSIHQPESKPAETPEKPAEKPAEKPKADHGMEKYQAIQSVFDAPHWKLLRNVSVGVMDAIQNTSETLLQGAIGGDKPAGERFEDAFPELAEAWTETRKSLDPGDSWTDELTSGISQFTVPFLGWMKAMQGIGMGKGSGALAAEGATMFSAFDAHADRFADLMKVIDDKYGTNLNDGFMAALASDEGGEVENRFKNAIDSMGFTAAAGATLWAGYQASRVVHDPVVRGRAKLALAGAYRKPSGGPAAQLGMVAFHGTPHQFDKFTLAHIGSGEGAQAYGWGLYFAGDESVARYYKETLIQRKDGVQHRGVLDGVQYPDLVGVDKSAIDILALNDWNMKNALVSAGNIRPEVVPVLKDIQSGERRFDKNKGTIKKVDIPDDTDLLDYDAPLSGQPEKVRGAVEKLFKWANQQSRKQTGVALNKKSMTGRDLYLAIQRFHIEDQRGASEMFFEAGIPGLRYFDGNSRRKGEGHHNYVIWDEEAIKVLEDLE